MLAHVAYKVTSLNVVQVAEAESTTEVTVFSNAIGSSGMLDSLPRALTKRGDSLAVKESSND